MSPRDYRLGKRTESVEATRRRILDSAIEVFADEGFAGSSVHRIAERADVTRATVYYHFDSKMGLLAALVEDAAQTAGLRSVVAIGENVKNVADLRLLIYAFAEFWSSNEVVFRNVIGLSHTDPEATEVVERRDHNRREGLAALVDRLAERGQLDADIAPDVVEALWMLTSFPVFDHLHRRSDLDVEQAAEVLWKLCRGLFAPDLATSSWTTAPRPMHQRGGAQR